MSGIGNTSGNASCSAPDAETGMARTLRRLPWRETIPPGHCALLLLLGLTGQFLTMQLGGLAGMVAAPAVSILLMFAGAELFQSSRGNWKRKFGFRPVTFSQLRPLAGGLVKIFIGNAGLTMFWQFLLEYWSIPYAEEQNVVNLIRLLSGRPFLLLVLIFTVAGLIPLFEEMFFRRALYGLLRPLGGVSAFFLTGIIFSLAHFFLLGLPALFWMGLMFQYLYLKTRNLWIAVIAHGVVNLVATILALLAVALRTEGWSVY